MHNFEGLCKKNCFRPSKKCIKKLLLFAGIIAIIVSSMSSASADGGDMESARSQGRVSLGLSIAGMVICAVVIIVLVVILTSNPYGPY